jgi:hypothetical protein
MQMKSVCRVHRSSLPLDAKRGLIVTERLSIRFALASAGSFFSSFPMCQNKARSIIENLHFTRARGQQKYFEMHKLNQHVRMLSPLTYLLQLRLLHERSILLALTAGSTQQK